MEPWGGLEQFALQVSREKSVAAIQEPSILSTIIQKPIIMWWGMAQASNWELNLWHFMPFSPFCLHSLTCLTVFELLPLKKHSISFLWPNSCQFETSSSHSLWHLAPYSSGRCYLVCFVSKHVIEGLCRGGQQTHQHAVGAGGPCQPAQHTMRLRRAFFGLGGANVDR